MSNEYADLGFVKDEGDDHEDLGFVPSAPLPKYAPMQALEDTVRAVGQGVTMGHLPQIQGAIESGAVSGPEYEAAKAGVRTKLAEGSRRNPPLAFAGEMAGSVGAGAAGGAAATMALLRGISLLPAAQRAPYIAAIMYGKTLPKAAIEFAPGAVAGLAQNPGGDIDEPGAMRRRAANAAGGGLLSTLLGGVRSWSGGAAERQASIVAGLPKSEIKMGYKAGKPATIGRTMLDEEIIGKLIPRSKETLYRRADEAANRAGADKQEVIDIIEQELRDPPIVRAPSPQPGSPDFSVGSIPVETPPADIIDTRIIEKKIRDALKFNPSHPRSEGLENNLDNFLANLHRNLPGQPYTSIGAADKLKVYTGGRINWKKPRVDFSPEEKMDAALYSSLNDTIDETVDFVTTKSGIANPFLAGKLQNAKKRYGSLDTARKSLLDRIAADEARKSNLMPVVGPMEYGFGGLGFAGAMMNQSSTPETIAATLGSMIAARGARKYGRQVLARQLDNTSRALNYVPIYEAMTALPPSGLGAYDRSQSPWMNLRTTKE